MTLRRPLGYAFQAGQYLQVAVPKLAKPDSRGRSRQFSISSPPDDHEHLRVVFRVTGSGFKSTLMAASVGSIVTIDEAGGGFAFPRRPTRPQVLVAGGIGISPFMSYLFQDGTEAWRQTVTLIYGNQDPESAAYLPELKSLAQRQPAFSLVELYKRPTHEMFARLGGDKGRVGWRVVGPGAMVAVAVHGLRAGGVPAEDILTESFTGY